MAAKKKVSIDADKILLYDKLIACNPEIERKGDTNPYTSHNGNMFTHLSPDGILAIRLPEEERERFIKEYKTRLMESYGIIRKEYVEVPAGLLEKTAELKVWLDISFEYVRTLKAKPTTKSKG